MDDSEQADVMIQGNMYRLERAVEFYLIRNLGQWLPISRQHQHWEDLEAELEERFGQPLWRLEHWETVCKGCVYWQCRGGACMATDDQVLTILYALGEAGIWVQLEDPTLDGVIARQDESTLPPGPPPEGRLRLGPTETVKANGELVAQVKEQKAAIVHAVRAMQAHAFFDLQTADPRFETTECSACQQRVYVVTKPRRVAWHRDKCGKADCPGSSKAQTVAAQEILEAFITDRCLPRPAALLTWTSLRAALFAWCTARDIWLPPQRYLWEWLDKHYKRYAGRHIDLGPAWEGLALRLEEWLGEDEPVTEPTAKPARKKPRLVA